MVRIRGIVDTIYTIQNNNLMSYDKSCRIII